IRELPSTSTSTAPPASATYTGRVELTAAATAAARRAASSSERGPGRSVTRRRTWATPPTRTGVWTSTILRPPQARYELPEPTGGEGRGPPTGCSVRRLLSSTD